MKYTIKKVGNHWQAWQVDGRKIVQRGPLRACMFDSKNDAESMEDIENRWEKRKPPIFLDEKEGGR